MLVIEHKHVRDAMDGPQHLRCAFRALLCGAELDAEKLEVAAAEQVTSHGVCTAQTPQPCISASTVQALVQSRTDLSCFVAADTHLLAGACTLKAKAAPHKATAATHPNLPCNITPMLPGVLLAPTDNFLARPIFRQVRIKAKRGKQV